MKKGVKKGKQSESRGLLLTLGWLGLLLALSKDKPRTYKMQLYGFVGTSYPLPLAFSVCYTQLWWRNGIEYDMPMDWQAPFRDNHLRAAPQMLTR